MISLVDVQHDWRLLDESAIASVGKVKLISHEEFTKIEGFPVHYVQPWGAIRLLRWFPRIFWLLYAVQLLITCGRNCVLIVNGGVLVWLYAGMLNRLLIRRRKIMCWDLFVEVNSSWKRRILRIAIRGISLSVLWSRQQVKPHSEFLDVPEEKLLFLPFKANHSKGRRYDLPIGDFVFAGGNGKRDYRCMVEAVRDTGIPVIISATDPEVRRSIELLPNVIVLGAPEPAFAQLQAASRFVVVPMIYTGLKGGGEANFCNAMWHGKPVVAADSIAASDYILDGVTGFVVPSGDSAKLRSRILELWEDDEKIRQLGENARNHCERNFTHAAFIRRLLQVATTLQN